ncbi:hypothetical protein JX266_012596 [Neoarthrinium moseri]|nr:hypothetical protein JX266_012596 [Neoarthrinium moseri]
MHTPTTIRLLTTGLIAAASVAGFTGPATQALSLRYAGALIAAAVPAMAAPAMEVVELEARDDDDHIEARSPIPEPKKNKGKKNKKGKKKAKASGTAAAAAATSAAAKRETAPETPSIDTEVSFYVRCWIASLTSGRLSM